MSKSRRTSMVEPGQQYRPEGTGIAVATAIVQSVGPGRGGIPHVRYDLSLRLPSGIAMATERNRVLALDRFVAQYPIAVV